MPVSILNADGLFNVVSFPLRDLNIGSISIGKPLALSKNEDLTDDQLEKLKQLLKQAADVGKIPWYVEPLIPPPEFFESQFLNKIAEEAISYQKDKNAERSVSLNELALFVVKGGTLSRRGVLYRNEKILGQFIFTDFTEYNVQVGVERRAFLLASCTFPARPRITKITFNYDTGRKVVFTENPETGSWLENSEFVTNRQLKFIYEDDESITLQEFCQPEEFCVQHLLGKWKPSWGEKFELQDALDQPHYYPQKWDYSGHQPATVVPE